MSNWNFDEKFASSLAHYRAGEFEQAIAAFSEIIDVLPDEWNSRLYLAMALYKVGQRHEAAEQIQFIKNRCPDPEIRAKADSSGRLITVEINKPAPTAPASSRPVNPTPAESSQSPPPRRRASDEEETQAEKLGRATGQFVKRFYPTVYKTWQTMTQNYPGDEEKNSKKK